MAVPKVNLPNLPSPLARLPRTASRAGRLETGQRFIPEESAIAFTYNCFSHAVMMADLEDFAAGLSLTEGMSIPETSMQPYSTRRRHIAGATGCGLCGIESLHEASRPARRVGAGLRVALEVVSTAMAALPPAQILNREARAVHADAFW